MSFNQLAYIWLCEDDKMPVGVFGPHAQCMLIRQPGEKNPGPTTAAVQAAGSRVHVNEARSTDMAGPFSMADEAP